MFYQLIVKSKNDQIFHFRFQFLLLVFPNQIIQLEIYYSDKYTAVKVPEFEVPISCCDWQFWITKQSFWVKSKLYFKNSSKIFSSDFLILNRNDIFEVSKFNPIQYHYQDLGSPITNPRLNGLNPIFFASQFEKINKDQCPELS